ncbi:12847_t:CDS:2, partial [Entrophospora sp. SA101]
KPSNSINHGRQFTGVWRQFIQGQEKGNGIYEGEHISCHKKWAFAKPGILCSHLANECNELLSGRFLDNQVAFVNQKIDNILQNTTNITLGTDGWTNPNGSNLWNFM